MTRVTNFGRKRNYLEAGFTTEPTTSNEHPVSTANDDPGDSVQPKKKRKRTKTNVDVGDEQTLGGNDARGEVGAQGKGKDPAVGQEGASITKKRGGARGGHGIPSFLVRD